MYYNFSQKLRERLIEYFKRHHDLEVSHDQADEWLDSMAGLYLAFSTMNSPDCEK